MQITHVSQEVHGSVSTVLGPVQRSALDNVAREDRSEASLPYHEATECVQSEAALHFASSNANQTASADAKHRVAQLEEERQAVLSIQNDRTIPTTVTEAKRWTSTVPKVLDPTGWMIR